jgi:hypothetical protein
LRETAGRCKVTFQYTSEFRCTSLIDMSSMVVCHFIQLIPRMTSITSPLNTMRSVLNTCPAKSSGTFRTIQSASTRPLGLLITYGAPNTTSVNLAFLAQVELIKSFDAPESNSTMIGLSDTMRLVLNTAQPSLVEADFLDYLICIHSTYVCTNHIWRS